MTIHRSPLEEGGGKKNIAESIEQYQEILDSQSASSDAIAFAEWIVEKRWQPTSSNQWEQVDKSNVICSKEHTTSEVYKLFKLQSISCR